VVDDGGHVVDDEAAWGIGPSAEILSKTVEKLDDVGDTIVALEERLEQDVLCAVDVGGGRAEVQAFFAPKAVVDRRAVKSSRRFEIAECRRFEALCPEGDDRCGYYLFAIEAWSSSDPLLCRTCVLHHAV
jgi:hypothetical protein